MKNENNIDFLNQLSDVPKEKKKRYQSFIAELGFEKVQVLIPLEKSEEFSEQARLTHPETRKQLTEIVKQFSGLVEEG